GAVAAVRRRGQPDDQQARPRVAEPGDRPPPVLLVFEAAHLVARDAAAVTAQPRAALAGDHRVAHGLEAVETGPAFQPGRGSPRSTTSSPSSARRERIGSGSICSGDQTPGPGTRPASSARAPAAPPVPVSQAVAVARWRRNASS